MQKNVNDVWRRCGPACGFDPNWKRFMRPDAWRYIRPDISRFMPAGAPVHSGRDVVKYFWPVDYRSGIRDRKFDPNQPRVPAGSAGGRQWTSDSPNRFPNASGDAQPWIASNLDAQCTLQYRLDVLTCAKSQSRACYAQAMLRYANCLAGLPIPPLNF
jgi:hypothetical protein